MIHTSDKNHSAHEKTGELNRRGFLKFASSAIAIVAVAGGAGYTLSRSQSSLKGTEVPVTEENMSVCICPLCPTYVDTPLTGGLYCGTGKVKEEVKETGCLCPSCPVTEKYGLTTTYYCVIGRSLEVE